MAALGLAALLLAPAGRAWAQGGTFRLVSPTNGIDIAVPGINNDFGFGAAFVDYDGDGDLDLFAASGRGYPAWLFRQDNGLFTDVASEAGVADTNNGTGVKFADYDNDGDQDFFLGNVGGPNRLFRNNGDGTFDEVSQEAGMAYTGLTYGSAWGDFDRDGWLDLYVVNRREPNLFYHNQGDGTFVERAAELGIDNDRAGLEAVWFDYDNDYDLDLYLSNDRLGGNRLWRNNDDGTFTDVSWESNTQVTINSMGVAVGDYDNNGYLDLYITNTQEGNVFLHNNGDGTFKDVAFGLGMQVKKYGWGTAFLDYDNDGDLDLYVVNWAFDPDPVVRPLEYNQAKNLMFRNIGNGLFVDDTDAIKVGDHGPGYALTVGDYNDDGYLDMFVSNKSANEKRYPCAFYENIPSGNRWVKIRTVGVESNRDGIGARVKIVSGNLTQIREVNGGSSYLAHNAKEVSAGIGGRDVIDLIEIHWPSGIVDRLYDVAPNQRLTVVENSTNEGEPPPAPSYDHVLEQNYPNPFNPRTNIAFTLPEAGPAKLSIFDSAGRLVRVLVNQELEAGPHEFWWTGHNLNGQPSPTGVYFYRLETAQTTVTRKMMLLK